MARPHRPDRGIAMSRQVPGERPHIVVIGAGFGGLFATRALVRANVRLTVIDRTNHHVFQPLLYQVATALLSPEDIAVSIRSVFSRNPHVRILMGEVTRIDPDRRLVHLGPTHLTVPYDFLVVATGARHAYFGSPEWEALAPGLKTLEDALDMRQEILSAYESAERDRHGKAPVFVVAGGGPTGVELAGTLAHMAHHTFARDFPHVNARRARILLAEAGPRLLSTFSPALAEHARRSLEASGVEVRTGCPVRDLSPGRVRLGEEWIRTTVVLWAAGNQASVLGRKLGAPTDRSGRVAVLPDLSVPDHPEIFVVGDLALSLDRDGHPLPGTAPVAIQEGRHAAAMIRKRLAGGPTRAFAYRGHGQMATLGKREAVVELGPLKVAGRLGWLLWLTVHLVALIGFQNRLLVLVRWAADYWADQPGARILFTGGSPRRPSHISSHPSRPSA